MLGMSLVNTNVLKLVNINVIKLVNTNVLILANIIGVKLAITIPPFSVVMFESK